MWFQCFALFGRTSQADKSGNNVLSRHRKKQTTVESNSPWLSDDDNLRVFFTLSNKMWYEHCEKSSSMWSLKTSMYQFPAFNFKRLTANALQTKGFPKISRQIQLLQQDKNTAQHHRTIPKEQQSRICKFDNNVVRFQKQKEVKLECFILGYAWMHSRLGHALNISVPPHSSKIVTLHVVFFVKHRIQKYVFKLRYTFKKNRGKKANSLRMINLVLKMVDKDKYKAD